MEYHYAQCQRSFEGPRDTERKNSQAYAVRRMGLDEWEDLNGLPGWTPFHSSVWISIIRDAYDAAPMLLVAERDGQLAGAWPMLTFRRGPFRIIGSPLPGWASAYLGPLIARGWDAANVAAALLDHRDVRKAAYMACRVAALHGLDLDAFGFRRLRDFETYSIDLLETEEVLWNNLKSECRTRIRRARKSGLKVCEGSADYIETYWRQAVGAFAKKGRRPSFSRPVFDMVFQRLVPAGIATVLTAFDGPRPVAFLILLLDSRGAYYWAGGSEVDARNKAPNNLLQWEAILHAKRKGLVEYDLIGTKNGPGRFKKTFGPRTTIAATHWERARSPLILMLKDAYERRARKHRRYSQRSRNIY